MRKSSNITLHAEVAAVFSSDGGNLPARDGRIHHNTDRVVDEFHWVKQRIEWKFEMVQEVNDIHVW